jgi:glutamine synthetase
VAIKAQDHLRSTGVADVAYFGPEAEFYVLDHVAFDQQAKAKRLESARPIRSPTPTSPSRPC